MSVLTEITAFEAGAAAERDRIRAVMALPEAQGREGAALHIALAADVPIEAVKVILANIPAGPVPTMNTRAVIPRHLRLATCRDIEGAVHAIHS
ncbi:MAG: hypothetical protein JWQ94_88 [Tardiphaga sp.]|nr:hypothetical protein [Tardiphaga sp.]